MILFGLGEVLFVCCFGVWGFGLVLALLAPAWVVGGQGSPGRSSVIFLLLALLKKGVFTRHTLVTFGVFFLLFGCGFLVGFGLGLVVGFG